MPGLDFTPALPSGRQLIQSYGGMRFRIAGEIHAGSVVVFPERTRAWSVREAGDVSLESLAPAMSAVGILVIGCGPVFLPAPKGLRQGLKERGLVLEWMDTGAACRTFNVLLAEDRPSAAALIAVE